MAGRQAARRVALTGPVTVTGTLGVGAGAAGSWLPLPLARHQMARRMARTQPADHRTPAPGSSNSVFPARAAKRIPIGPSVGTRRAAGRPESSQGGR